MPLRILTLIKEFTPNVEAFLPLETTELPQWIPRKGEFFHNFALDKMFLDNRF
jgi:hypothetical protein